MGDIQLDNPIQVGQVFADRYEILEHLGTGGMSSVYKALDLLVGQIVAIKLIQPVIAQNEKLLQKFKQESLVARKLAHPNVIRIYDIGEYRGHLYISMEFIDGRTLSALVAEQGRFSPSDFLSVFRQFCTALSYVHSQQIIHRDINPLNLMMDRSGVLKLMDFGIARDLSADSTQLIPIGTPAYMAPELLRGQPPTPASDIYSAGVMFYELLVGKRPTSSSKQGSSLHKEVPEIPPALAHLVEKCLESDPLERYQSVEEMGEAAARIDLRLTVASQSLKTLADFLEVGPKDPAAVLPLFLETLDRLEESHQKGRLHQELLPKTIQVSDEGKVALVLYEESGASQTLGIGDPKYSSPEMFREHAGDDKKFRLTSDIYVLGFIFYEILLGKKAFASQFSEIQQEDQNFQWLSWHSDLEKPVRPLNELLSNCPKLLSETLQRMMEKHPERRIQSMVEVAEALKKVKAQLQRTEEMKSRTVIFSPSPKPEPVPVVPFSLQVGLAVEGLVALLLMAGFTFWLIRSGPSQLPIETQMKVEKPSNSVEERKETKGPSTKDKTQPQEVIYPPRVETETGTMLLIPEGEFIMGNDQGRVSKEFQYQNEFPAHAVRLPAFYIDKYEATNGLYKKFCDATGRSYPPNPPWDPRYFNKANYPVFNVSWDDARAFAAWAGKRLPTEAQWEKAARGTDGRLYPWGNQFRPGAANLRGAEDGRRYAAPVGSFPLDASPYGVMDMAGNVFEWVEDEYNLYPGNPVSLPEKERGLKVIRGGGFEKADEEIARTTTRGSSLPQILEGHPYFIVGFRCSLAAESILQNMGKQ